MLRIHSFSTIIIDKRLYMLVAEKITKSYGELKVLKGVDLQVADGEIVCIVGSSGAGKSTLLHILGTLDQADSGTMFIGGQRVDNLKSKTMARFRNQHLGFVFQFHHLLPEFTSQENVAMPLWIRRELKDAANAKALERLSQVGLENRALHRPAELSGGERQRVAIARAMVTQPACVLADEPTGNLDRATAESVFDLMLSTAEKQGTAFVVVTHDPQLAARCSRVLRLDKGVLQS